MVERYLCIVPTMTHPLVRSRNSIKILMMRNDRQRQRYVGNSFIIKSKQNKANEDKNALISNDNAMINKVYATMSIDGLIYE